MLLDLSAFRRPLQEGVRLGFTAPNRELGIANRDLGTVDKIENDGVLTVRMDNGKSVSFDAHKMRHFDHGYAATSHSSQGLTADRVLVNIDSNVHPDLTNARFAYVAVSRGSRDAHLHTDDSASLWRVLSKDVAKASAIETANIYNGLTMPDVTERLSGGGLGASPSH